MTNEEIFPRDLAKHYNMFRRDRCHTSEGGVFVAVTLFPYGELNGKQTVRLFGSKCVSKVANVCLYVLIIILTKATWKASLISASHLVIRATVALMFGSLAISIFPALIGKKLSQA